MNLNSLPLTLDAWINGWYPFICEKLNLSSDDDIYAMDYALKKWSHLSAGEEAFYELIKEKTAIVFGCGPSLNNDIKQYLSIRKNIEQILVASDGATQALLENKLTPDLVVTDLDGDPESLVTASKQGSYFLIHVHGDNLDKLEALIPKLNSPVIFTTQVYPKHPIKNYFGFTDGDRAVFALNHFSIAKIILLGFDLGNVVGAYSKPALSKDTIASPFKKAKLTIAKLLLGWLQMNSTILIFNATQGVEDDFVPISNLTSSLI